MAYVSQELKAKLAPQIKAVCKKYGIRASLAVRHHSTLVLNIKSGKIDFIGNCNLVCGRDHYQVSRGFQPIKDGYVSVNPYHYKSHFSGRALKFLCEVIPLMYGPDYYDHSDPQTDYFNCSHYIELSIGKWDKPYIVE